MNYKNYVDYLLNWLEENRINLYKLDGYVLGVSGGIDSAVCAHLLARLQVPTKALLLPANVSSEVDLSDGLGVCDDCQLEREIIDIEPLYQLFLQTLNLNNNDEQINVLRGNLMARIRMILLFTTAQNRRAVVLGTDNLAEWHMGYFTKFGDGAADLLPLAALRKEEVFDLAKYLGVRKEIINKQPSAGLWHGQTDEGEMGVTYVAIDAFLRGETVSDEALERINFWHERSHHKRQLAPQPKRFNEIHL